MVILVVDDEPHISRMLQFLFEKRGHQVMIAADGESAIEAARLERPAVIFLDLNLPGINGFEVCKLLRQSEPHRSTPIYMLTAQGQEIDRQRGMDAGATGYITKPFAPSRLVEIVNSHVPGGAG